MTPMEIIVGSPFNKKFIVSNGEQGKKIDVGSFPRGGKFILNASCGRRGETGAVLYKEKRILHPIISGPNPDTTNVEMAKGIPEFGLAPETVEVSAKLY